MWQSRYRKGVHWSLLKALANPWLRMVGWHIVSVTTLDYKFICYEFRRWRRP